MRKLMNLLKANTTAERKPVVSNLVGEEVTILLYDVIDADLGFNAAEFVQVMSKINPMTTVNLRINSPGGDVFEGRAIANAIKNFQGKVICHIDALCASAATTAAMACDEVKIAKGSFFMIHNGWTITIGDKTSLRKTADLLEKVDNAICSDYETKTGIAKKDICKMMDAETWLSAEEAVAMKFCDTVVDGGKVVNTYDVSMFDKAPEALLNKAKAETISITVDASAAIEEAKAAIEQAKQVAEAEIANQVQAQRLQNERRLRLLTLC